MATTNLKSINTVGLIIQSGNGTPDHISPLGSKYTDLDTGLVWENKLAGWSTYKKYVALLTQTGANPPVATVLENTLSGIPVWTYVFSGSYGLELNGEWGDLSKVVVLCTANSTSGVGGFVTYEGGKYATSDANTIYINTWNDDTVSKTADMADDLLFNSAIEIRVYMVN